MIDQAALFRAFQDFARALLQSYDVGPTLYRLTDQVVEILGVDGAGVSLTHDQEWLTFVTATEGQIAVIERAQIAAGDGPCHRAFRTGQQVVVRNLAAEDRFHGYRDAAVEHGVSAVMGIPMPIGERRLGALNVYRYDVWDWTSDEVDTAQLLADMASGYILNTVDLQQARTHAGQLQQALDSRIIIEQAKGILIERHHIADAEAFNRLRAHSRSNNIRLHTLARRVVDGAVEL